MNATRGTRGRRLAAWTAAALLLAGCAFPHKLRVTEQGAPQYSRVSLVYEVNAGRGALAPRFLDSTPGEIISFPRQPASPVESAVLRLEYPHPHGPPETARVTVRLSRLTIEDRQALAKRDGLLVRLVSARDEHIDDDGDSLAEIFELAISKPELDLLLVDLAQSGYFDPNLTAAGGTRLAAEIDGATARKAWVPEPRLDDVITRLRADGLPLAARQIPPAGRDLD
ncbi:MAG: hypothetical protein WD069_13635 [Planctomycetales bacterium]